MSPSSCSLVGAALLLTAHMKKDTDLDPLRDRDDFRKLLGELEEKGKAPASKP